MHRILLSKYPKLKHVSKSDLPDYKIAACVKGISDSSIVPYLQKLLIASGVRVIEMQEAINFCLDAYKQEMIIEYADEPLEQQTHVSIKEIVQKKKKKGKESGGKKEKKDKSPTKKKKGEKVAKKRKKNSLVNDVESVFDVPLVKKEQGNQTPRIFPCEELVLSPKAELGKIAFELLGLGETLNAHLLTAVFFEFLKSLNEIRGWALINYPETTEQAALLEESLTSRPVPAILKKSRVASSIDDLLETESREVKNYDDPFKEKRVSKLVEMPLIPDEDGEYETRLTAFIQLKVAEEPLQMGQQYVEEEHDDLDIFYTEQGCNYIMEYKSLDFNAIKHLAKLVIGKFTIPPSTSLELFGDTVLYIEDELKKKAESKVEVTSTKKGEKKKDKKKGSKKSSKSTAEPDDKTNEKASKKGSKKTDKGGGGDAKGKKGKKDKSDKGSKKSKGGKKKNEKAEEVEPKTFEEKETQIPEPEEEPELPPGKYAELFLF